MGVSKNRGTPKWMVKIMETPIKMDDLEAITTIFRNTHMIHHLWFFFHHLLVGHLSATKKKRHGDATQEPVAACLSSGIVALRSEGSLRCDCEGQTTSQQKHTFLGKP